MNTKYTYRVLKTKLKKVKLFSNFDHWLFKCLYALFVQSHFYHSKYSGYYNH